MIEDRDVVVVGAGIVGLSAGWALARRGRDVVVLDQAPVGHAGAGSKGSCRVFRYGYDDPLYVALVRQARPLWAELEHLAGETLLHPTPQLSFGEEMPTILGAMRQAGASCELLSADQAAEMFPGVVTYGSVLLEPDSAVIAADRALAALARLIPDVRTDAQVVDVTDDGPGVTVSLGDGESGIRARHLIVCAGPSTAMLLARTGIDVPGSATSEQVAYVATASPEPIAGMPIFIDYGHPTPYGLPVPGSTSYKVGLHHDGPRVDPDHRDQAPDPVLGERIEQAVKRLLPSFDPRPVAVERCIYDNSPDEDFIIDAVGNVVIGSGTSGHGFKFGPLIGEWLAVLATADAGAGQPGPRAQDADAPPARFAVNRFRRTNSRTTTTASRGPSVPRLSKGILKSNSIGRNHCFS